MLLAENSGEFSNLFGVSQVIKLAVDSRVELFLESEPLAISQSEHQTTIHEGEVFAGVQGVFLCIYQTFFGQLSLFTIEL
jgi:hypothetical protein